MERQSEGVRPDGGYKTGAGTVTGTSNQYNRTTGFTFDSTPILVSFGVPVPAETLEPRTRKVNSSELRFASDLDSPSTSWWAASVSMKARIWRYRSSPPAAMGW